MYMKKELAPKLTLKEHDINQDNAEPLNIRDGYLKTEQSLIWGSQNINEKFQGEPFFASLSLVDAPPH